jgi:hypothetical protein
MTQSSQKTNDRPSPAEEARRLYEDAEARTAKAFEEMVSRDSFGELLAKVTENVVALTRITNDSFDLVVRNLRLAGRPDLVRVGRQLARTEDKLEMVLQEVERLREDVKNGGGAQPGGSRSQRSSSADSRPSSAATSQAAASSEGSKA